MRHRAQKGFDRFMEQPKPNYVYPAKLVEVIDGDTYTFILDQGLNGMQRENIRLRGYGAKELHEPGGPEAKKHAEGIFEHAHEIVVQTYRTRTSDQNDPRFKRTFVRYVGDVWIDSVPMYVAMGDDVHPGTSMGIPHEEKR